jgi:hypothetical protein
MDGAKDGNLENIYLEFQGKRISNIVSLNKGEKVTFDLV